MQTAGSAKEHQEGHDQGQQRPPEGVPARALITEHLTPKAGGNPRGRPEGKQPGRSGPGLEPRPEGGSCEGKRPLWGPQGTGPSSSFSLLGLKPHTLLKWNPLLESWGLCSAAVQRCVTSLDNGGSPGLVWSWGSEAEGSRWVQGMAPCPLPQVILMLTKKCLEQQQGRVEVEQLHLLLSQMEKTTLRLQKGKEALRCGPQLGAVGAGQSLAP